ncbi:MAG: phage major capsid protein, partial [Acetanaerobacterium sp.]
IRVSGAGSDCVEKFFSTTESAALFPEYVARAVRQGIGEADVLERIVATKTVIDGMDYRSIASNPGEDKKALRRVAEGAAIPETTVTTQENLVKLYKRGRMLVASYEAVRFAKLDLFTVTLRQIGAYIASAQLDDAVRVLTDGDGNSNPITSIATGTAGGISYQNLVALWQALDPYSLNTLIASPAVIAKLLCIDELKDAVAGLNFQGTGKLVTPLGAVIVKANAAQDAIIGIDKGFALEMVSAQEVSIDYDRLIDRQLERAAVTSIAGFAKIFTDASKRLTLTE